VRRRRGGSSPGGGVTSSEAHRAIEAVWRIESARLIAGLARMVRAVGLAEDLAQEALVAALEQWPESGVPDNPGAWLMATGKHRGIDRMRRREVLQRKQQELGREIETRRETGEPDLDAIDDRSVAVAMAFGPEAGLEIVDALASERALEGYHLMPSVRGDFLARLGRHEEASEEFQRAASLTRDARERSLLLDRAAESGREAAGTR
jgi:predicted RNA polymerase sigma factor